MRVCISEPDAGATGARSGCATHGLCAAQPWHGNNPWHHGRQEHYGGIWWNWWNFWDIFRWIYGDLLEFIYIYIQCIYIYISIHGIYIYTIFSRHRSQGGCISPHQCETIRWKDGIYNLNRPGSRVSNRVKAQNPVSWRRVIYRWAWAFRTCWLLK